MVALVKSIAPEGETVTAEQLIAKFVAGAAPSAAAPAAAEEASDDNDALKSICSSFIGRKRY